MALGMSAISNSTISNISLPEFSFSNFSLFEYINTIKPLLFFVVGVTIYALFVFKFYRFLAKKDILRLELDKYAHGFTGFLKHIAQAFFNLIEKIILIPILIFFWFAVIATLMLLISKNQAPEVLLLTSVALVAAVRITAYYNENLSQDLAKMVPFALLGVFLIDVSYVSWGTSLSTAKQIISLWRNLLYYLIFVISLEFVLRILSVIAGILKTKEQTEN